MQRQPQRPRPRLWRSERAGAVGDAMDLARPRRVVTRANDIVERAVGGLRVIRHFVEAAAPVACTRLPRDGPLHHPRARAVARHPQETDVVLTEEVAAIVFRREADRCVGVMEHETADDGGRATFAVGQGAVFHAVVDVGRGPEPRGRCRAALRGEVREGPFVVGPAVVASRRADDVDLLVVQQAHVADEQPSGRLVDAEAEGIAEAARIDQPLIDRGAVGEGIARGDHQRFVGWPGRVGKATHIHARYPTVERGGEGGVAGCVIVTEARVQQRVRAEA